MSDGLDGASSFLGGADPAVIEQLHAQYLRDPGSVDPSWRRIFESEGAFDDGDGAARSTAASTQPDEEMGLPEPRPPALPVVGLAVSTVTEVEGAVHRVVDVQSDCHPVRPVPRVGLYVVVQAVSLGHFLQLGAERQDLRALFVGHVCLWVPRGVRYLPVIMNQREPYSHFLVKPVVDRESQSRRPGVLAACNDQSHIFSPWLLMRFSD